MTIRMSVKMKPTVTRVRKNTDRKISSSRAMKKDRFENRIRFISFSKNHHDDDQKPKADHNVPQQG
jgi:hypothetical protein